MQELLGWLLEDPAAMGASIGLLIDEVVDMKRLERTVARHDEVRADALQGSLCWCQRKASTVEVSEHSPAVRGVWLHNPMALLAPTVWCSIHASIL